MRRLLFLLLIAISLIGCGNGYFFETQARYYAEASNLQVDITAKGHVLDGNDLTDGVSTGKITSLKFSDTIFFQANTTGVTLLKYKKIKITNPSSFAISLAYCLNAMGYLNYNKQELVELGEVIRVISYGPKGTYVSGQPDIIKVIYVNFETDRGFQKKK